MRCLNFSRFGLIGQDGQKVARVSTHSVQNLHSVLTDQDKLDSNCIGSRLCQYDVKDCTRETKNDRDSIYLKTAT